MTAASSLETAVERPDIRSAAETPRAPDLYSLAKNAYEDADGNVEAAIDDVISAITGSENLLKIVIRQTAEVAVKAAVGSVMRADRAAIYNTVRPAASGRAAVAALASGVARSILDFPLAGGLKLRDASRADVQRQADLYSGFARDQEIKARWLKSIADRIPDGKQVGDVLNDSDVEQILRQVSL